MGEEVGGVLQGEWVLFGGDGEGFVHQHHVAGVRLR
jgi:hypothetical protein